MPFCYVHRYTAKIPDLGEDYSSVYRYPQIHKTLNLWLNVWNAHVADIRANGTPSLAQHFMDMTTVFWNKCMGNVETAQKVIRQEVIQHDSNCGPGLLDWLVLLDYIM